MLYHYPTGELGLRLAKAGDPALARLRLWRNQHGIWSLAATAYFRQYGIDRLAIRGRYVLGQASLAACNGVASFIFLSIIQAPFPAVLAFLAFLFSLVPLVSRVPQTPSTP